MADVTIHFDIRFSRATFRWLLAALFLGAAAGDVGSESVTLNTYYPAPSGVYQYMITTNQSFLARDAGVVNIGMNSSVPPAQTNTKLAVNGAVAVGGDYVTSGTNPPVNGLVVEGNVGIGTNNPGAALEVSGGIRTTSIGQSIGARYTTGSDNYLASISWAQGVGGVLELGNNGYNEIRAGRTAPGGALSFVVNNTADDASPSNGTTAMTIAANGQVGIGTPSPFSALDVAGGDQVLTVRQSGCSLVGYAAGVSNCPGGEYATEISGVMTQYQALANQGGEGVAGNGTMLCCACPSGGCGVPGW